VGSKTANIQKRKRLQALFERGRLVHFNAEGEVPEPDPDGMSVWVGPPSPLQREQAVRDAQAARSRALLAARRDDPDSEASQVRAMLGALDDEGIINYLLVSEEPTRIAEARRRVLAEDEWEDFNSLRDAMRQYEEAGMPDDEEWKPLLERDIKFGDQVQEKADELRLNDGEVLRLLPRAEHEKRIVDRTVDQVGSSAFMRTYDRQMLWYGVRDDENHDELFFETADELFSLPLPIQDAIRSAYDEFVTEAGEAKNSPRVASGSDSSVLPVKPETTETSGPQESNE
jgi:hypothetical protein